MSSMNTSKLKLIYPSYIVNWVRPHEIKRHRVHIRRLNKSRRRSAREAKAPAKKLRKSRKEMMIIENLKLYKKNESIKQENERLRKQALLLHQENTALFFQLHKASPPH